MLPARPNDCPWLPALGAHEVLVENQAIAFNPVDWKLMERGHPAWQPGQIPGADGMGTIATVGSGVMHLRVGARVAYHTDLRKNGSFARHTVVASRALLTVPEALSDAAAASLPCPGLTAWQALAKYSGRFRSWVGDELCDTAAACARQREAAGADYPRSEDLIAVRRERAVHPDLLRRFGH